MLPAPEAPQGLISPGPAGPELITLPELLVGGSLPLPLRLSEPQLSGRPHTGGGKALPREGHPHAQTAHGAQSAPGQAPPPSKPASEAWPGCSWAPPGPPAGNAHADKAWGVATHCPDKGAGRRPLPRKIGLGHQGEPSTHALMRPWGMETPRPSGQRRKGGTEVGPACPGRDVLPAPDCTLRRGTCV